MKKASFLLLLLSASVYTTVLGQVKSVDSLVAKAFAAIKNNDEQAFISLFPTYPQTKVFFANLLNSITDTAMKEGLGAKMNDLTEDVYNKEIRTKFIESFQEFVSKGRKMGIDWTQATLDSFTSKEVQETGIDIRQLKGKIFFTADEKQYIIPFTDAIWSKADNGWFGFDMKNILKKGEDTAFDSDVIEVTQDVILQEVVEAPQPPPPTPKKSSVQKPVTKKTVTKKPVIKTTPVTNTKPKS